MVLTTKILLGGLCITAIDFNLVLINICTDYAVLIAGNQSTNRSYVCNVSKSSEVDELFKQVENNFGEPATIVINCAGIARIAPFLEITEEQFNLIIENNMKVQTARRRVQILFNNNIYKT